MTRRVSAVLAAQRGPTAYYTGGGHNVFSILVYVLSNAWLERRRLSNCNERIEEQCGEGKQSQTWATAAAEIGLPATGYRHQRGNEDLWVENTAGAQWIDKTSVAQILETLLRGLRMFSG